MGLFSSSSSRRSSRSDADRTPKSRLTRIRSVLALKEAAKQERRSTSSERVRKPKAPLLTVTVFGSSTPSGPCRYIATPHKLGSGAYGAVLLGHDANTDNPVAMKFIPDGRMRTSSLDREVSMLQRLSEVEHPALLKFHGRFRPEDVKAEIRADGSLPLPKPHTQCHALVMEMVRGGELFDYVVKREGLGEPEAAPLFAQLADAVRAAHGLGIAHRDLKLENVLLVRNKHRASVAERLAGIPVHAQAEAPAGAAGKIKLIDWGLAHQHVIGPDGRSVPEKLHSRCGSRSYMAPEVTNREISGTVGYDGYAADVWSLGVCLFAIHLAFFPFEQANPELDWRARRVVEAQRKGQSTMATILSFYPQKAPHGGLSPALLALLDRMLVFNPEHRATLPEVLSSEFLAPHVPMAVAAELAALVPRPPALARASTRTSRSVSVSSSEGPLTPRDDESSHRSRHSRSDSSGSQLSTHSQYHLPFPPSLPEGQRASMASSVVSSVSSAGGVDARVRTTPLPPPPPSPLREQQLGAAHVQVVVAGASRHGNGGAGGGPHKQGRHESSVEGEQLAALMAKACKVTDQGSPRHPDRGHVGHELVL